MIYGIEQTITYIAWETAENAGKTGDAANHTLRWIANGASNAPANAPAEVDATNAPGVYKLTLTAAEWQTYQGTLAGVSSTADVSIIPQQFTTVRLPDAAPGGNGGLGTVDANNRIAGIAGTKNTLDNLNDITAAAAGTDAASKVLATPAQKLATDASGYVTAGNMRGTDDAAKAGDKMDIVDAPNATAVTAVQSGLATAAKQDQTLALQRADWKVDPSNSAQWQYKKLDEDGKAVLLVKNIADIDGAPVTAAATPIAKAVKA